MKQESHTKQDRVKKVNFCFYPQTINQVNKLSEKYQRSISNLIRWLIDKEAKTLGEDIAE